MEYRYVWTGVTAVDPTGPECVDGYQKFTNFECGGGDVGNFAVDWTTTADLQ